jgi:hypothetical protein
VVLHSSDALEAAGFAELDLVGRGASGVVYRAVDRSTGLSVALKVLHPGVDVARVEREAALLASVDHPRVVGYVRHGTTDGLAYLATAWVEGRSLRDRLALGPVATAEVMRWSADLVGGLGAIHAAGLVHRDLNPDNVLLDGHGRPVVIDLGVATGDEVATLTADGLTPGTPRYVAPEVLGGAPASPASDQYSLALLIYELLTGRSPFPAADHAAAALHHQVRTPPVPLREVDPYQPAAVECALERALAKDPDHRFATIADLAEALQGPAPPKRWGTQPLVAAGAVAALAVGLGCGWLLGRSGGDRVVDSAGDQSGVAASSREETPTAPAGDQAGEPSGVAWPAGTAAGLSCNLLEQADFDRGDLPDNYFADADVEQLAVVEVGVGVDGTAGLVVGTEGRYGLYGTIVPVASGLGYIFTAAAGVSGAPEQADLGLQWLDDQFEELGEPVRTPITQSGRVQVVVGEVPTGAAYAVPFVFKDGTVSGLVVDELVFFRSDADCALFVAATQ